MTEGRDAFLKALKDKVGNNTPTEEQVRVTDIAKNYYVSIKGGEVVKHVTTTMLMYLHSVLPDLSAAEVKELIYTVHTIIETVLTYLVEDGLIKEE